MFSSSYSRFANCFQFDKNTDPDGKQNVPSFLFYMVLHEIWLPNIFFCIFMNFLKLLTIASTEGIILEGDGRIRVWPGIYSDPLSQMLWKKLAILQHPKQILAVKALYEGSL